MTADNVWHRKSGPITLVRMLLIKKHKILIYTATIQENDICYILVISVFCSKKANSISRLALVKHCKRLMSKLFVGLQIHFYKFFLSYNAEVGRHCSVVHRIAKQQLIFLRVCLIVAYHSHRRSSVDGKYRYLTESVICLLRPFHSALGGELNEQSEPIAAPCVGVWLSASQRKKLQGSVSAAVFRAWFRSAVRDRLLQVDYKPMQWWQTQCSLLSQCNGHTLLMMT